MATAARGSWRNAACIMMLSGPFKFCGVPSVTRIPTNPLKIGNKSFLQYTDDLKVEPEIIFVKRHSKSGFMANVYVFPGGVLDKADYSPSWSSIFSDYRQPFASILSLRDSGLPIYKAVPLDGSSFPGEVAFRICAIRELFEEAGILLARHKSEVDSVLNVVPGSVPPSISNLPKSSLEEWRSRVHSDANQFIAMCREWDCVPDIWSLIESSDWLTPRNYSRRFDTIFYTCYSEKKPESSPDQAEVTKTKWIAPSQADDLFKRNMLKFAPPQYTEIKKLQSMLDLGGVPLAHLFSLHQSTRKNEIFRKRSSRILTKGKTIVSVTELDDLTPHDPEDNVTAVQFPKSPELERSGITLRLSDSSDYEYEIPDYTAEQLRELSVTTNRMEYTSEKFIFSDTVESKKFKDFLAKFEGNSSKL